MALFEGEGRGGLFGTRSVSGFCFIHKAGRFANISNILRFFSFFFFFFFRFWTGGCCRYVYDAKVHGPAQREQSSLILVRERAGLQPR